MKKTSKLSNKIISVVLLAVIVPAIAGCDNSYRKDDTKQTDTEQSGGNENDSIIYRIEENDSLIHITSIPYAEKKKSAFELVQEHIDFDATDLSYRYFDIDFDGVDEVIFEEDDSLYSGRRGCFHYIFRKIGDSLVPDDELPFMELRDCYIIDTKNRTVTAYAYNGFDYSYVTFQKDPEKVLNPITSDFSDGTKEVFMGCVLENQEKMKLVRIEEHFYVWDSVDGGMRERVFTADHPEGMLQYDFVRYKINTSDTIKLNSIFDNELTSLTCVDSIGNVYPIYIDSDGCCFVFRLNDKTGKEYKFYLPDEISMEISKHYER